MSERDSEKNPRLERIPPLLEEPFKGDSRCCLRVFASLLDNLHAAISEHNVTMCIGEVIRDLKCVHHTSLVLPILCLAMDPASS